MFIIVANNRIVSLSKIGKNDPENDFLVENLANIKKKKKKVIIHFFLSF